MLRHATTPDAAFVTSALQRLGLAHGADFDVAPQLRVCDADARVRIDIHRPAWVKFFADKCALQDDVASARRCTQRLPTLAWQLDHAHALAMLRGLAGGDAATIGVAKSDFCVGTSCALFRDQLVRLALHAGMSAHFELDATAENGRQWRVRCSCAHPRFEKQDIKKVAGYRGGSWCVTVNSGNIVVRRKSDQRHGTPSWRPVIVSNCQGMGFLVATLLTQAGEEEAFWCFHEMMQQNLFAMRELYRPNFPMLQLCFFQLRKLMGLHTPGLLAHLDSIGLDVSIFASQWFLTLFTYHFPFRAVLRVWDVFMCEGWKIIFRVAITLLKWEEPAMLGQPLDVCMRIVRTISDGKNADQIMDRALALKFKTESLLDFRREYEESLRSTMAASAAPAAAAAAAPPAAPAHA